MSFIHDCPIPSAVGPLEGLLNVPDEPTGRAVVLCHPHPLYGGTMHSHVVYQAARAFRDRGFVVLRFNFRGVGRSPGRFDNGVGEGEDARAALALLADRYPGHDLWVGGYSFGSWVGFRVGSDDPRVRALVGIALPVSHSTFSFGFMDHCNVPVGVVQGTEDEHGDLEEVRHVLDGLSCPSRLEVVRGGGHFFEEQFDLLRTSLHFLIDWVEQQRAQD